MEKLEGLLLKAYGGFYFTEAGGEIYSCSLRGRFRIQHQNFLPGDRVLITPLERSKGVIEAVLPRRNELLRPPIANVEQAVITFALTAPEPDLLLLDRILLQVLAAGIEPLLCFNKQDLLAPKRIDACLQPYRAAGFTVVSVSASTGEGVAELLRAMHGHLSVLAGPSGVGKSSLLNRLSDSFQQETGELSRKIERGRHTTRRVELLKLSDQTYLADTPGFSNLYLPETLRSEELAQYYPELARFAGDCPFTSCRHFKERDCAVRDAVDSGELDAGRYERYIALYQELKEREGKF